MSMAKHPSRRRVLGMLASAPALVTAGGAAWAQPARKWTVTGARVPLFDGIDDAMRRVMQNAGIRAAALAVACKGKVLFEHGYTWAEPGYFITQPNSPFRLASVTKAFTVALTYELVKAGALTLDTRAFPYLALDPLLGKGRTVDPRLNDITVKQLVDNRSGLVRDINRNGQWGGPALREIAHALGLHRAPTTEELTRYMMGEQLQSAPGTQEVYSNFGHDVLGLVCAKAAKMDFISAVRKYVTGPHGIEAYLGNTYKEKRLPNEVFYDDSETGPTIEHPDSNQVLPSVYGGGVYLEFSTASGAMAASAGAVARMIGHYAAYGYGTRTRTGRGGAQGGTEAWAESLGNGLDLAYVFNTLTHGAAAEAEVNFMYRRVLQVLDDAHAGCEITVYWDSDLKGDAWRTTGDRTRLEGGWNDQISSIEVTSGNWEFFEHDSFGGKMLKLGPGRYPRMIDGWNDSISSFRCVEPTIGPAPIP
jgi:CubicO group peptidase (beta-lactamase class C family)